MSSMVLVRLMKKFNCIFLKFQGLGCKFSNIWDEIGTWKLQELIVFALVGIFHSMNLKNALFKEKYHCCLKNHSGDLKV